MSKKSLLAALEPFISEAMLRHTREFPDDTPLGLEVMGRNGYRLNLRLGQLRALWAEYQDAKYGDKKPPKGVV